MDAEDAPSWLRDRPYYEGQVEDERTLPGNEAATRDAGLDGQLAAALADRGVESLYDHQAEAVEAVRDGRNVVLATPTASGKSLAYTVPAVERATEGRRTLYLAPQNALVADQRDSLESLSRSLFGRNVTVAEYTGRTADSERRAVRDREPTLLLSNPDMLHYGILPNARRLWEWFFSTLDLVVVDEVHEYRGVFGSHVALLFRRLARVCEQFGADPQFVCCSATVGNPVEHAAAVTGQPAASFDLVDRDTSASGPTTWLCWNPPTAAGGEGRRRSAHVEAKNVFVDLVDRGLQTLVFTRARQTAERYAAESQDALRERGSDARIEAYQAALTDDRRREIEAGLRDGAVRGVWSTNALALGVDIGGLDAVVLDGYPGTRMNTFQRAGRAGRGSEGSLVALVAGENPLDQYVMSHPGELFDGDPERAVIDPGNGEILPDHLVCAARERWLSPADADRFEGFEATVEADPRLARRDTGDGPRWVADAEGSPHHEMGLRSAGDGEIALFDERSGDRLGSLSRSDAMRDAHPGAIYHHQGQTYEVTDLDLGRERATLAPTYADYYTRVRTEKEIEVRDDREERHPLREDVPVRYAAITLRERVTGFERRDAERGTTLGEVPLDMPEGELDTRACYYTVPTDVERDLRDAYGFAGAIHAAEHAMISMLPGRVLCDRGDVGGLSTPVHPHTNAPTVFVYDGYPGGVGLVRGGFSDAADWVGETLAMLRACDCESGCPACVQSPQCGNGNEPLDKAGAAALLERLGSPEPTDR